MTDGLVVVDKPAGLTSHDVVARLRRLLRTRRVGHAGTLDPMATGVLVAGVGRATRLLGHLQLADKAYDATIRLGSATHTDDAEGDVLSATDASHVDDAAVRAGIAALTGDLQQVPSAVSAIKVDGRRAHELVRTGARVQLAPRAVRVTAFDVLDIRRVDGGVDVDVHVACSSGTYVRALARDLGSSLGVGGHLTRLRRTRVGPFSIDEAAQLGAVPAVMSMAETARRCFPCAEVDEEQAGYVTHGRALSLQLPAGRPVALLTRDGAFLALYERHGDTARAVAVFA